MTRKRVLVTGCSGGLGAEIVRQYLQLGWRVVAAVTSLDRLGEMVALMGEPGLSVVAMDVRQAEEVSRVRDEVESSGGLDVLILNAGVHECAPVEAIDFSLAEQLMEVNFFGALRCVQSFSPLMRRQHSGRIIAVSSLSAHVGLPCDGLYAASKAALEKMLESLRVELAHFGVGVGVVVPSSFPSDLLGCRPERSLDIDSPYSALLAELMSQERAGPMATLASVAQVVVRLSLVDVMDFRVPVDQPAANVLQKIYRLDESQRAAAIADWSGVARWLNAH